MALCAAAGVFTAEDRSSVMRSAVMATETATSTPLAGRKMVFYPYFARRRQRLIVSPFNRVTFVTLPAGIAYVRLMSKRRSVGSALVLRRERLDLLLNCRRPMANAAAGLEACLGVATPRGMADITLLMRGDGARHLFDSRFVTIAAI